MNNHRRDFFSIVLITTLFSFLYSDNCMSQQTENQPIPTLTKTIIIPPGRADIWASVYGKSNLITTFSPDRERLQKGLDTAREILSSVERINRVGFGGGMTNGYAMEISPNEKYLLVRYFGQKSELYEAETSQFVTNGEKEEVMIGFDRNSNIYCGCQSITNMFVLRDPRTQKMIREYKTEGFLKDIYFPFEYSSREGYNPYYDGIQFTHLPAPIESPDGKYTLFFFSTYQLSAKLGIVTVCDNESGDVVARSCIGLSNPQSLKPQFNRNGTQVAIIDQIGRCFWVYDFTTHSSRSFFLPKSDHLMMQGFCFATDNQLITWTRHPTSPLFYSSYVIDTITGHCSSPAPCMFAKEGYYTAQYNFSPDRKTAITFAFESKKYSPDLPKTVFGKFLFWDVPSQEVIFETEEKYFQSILIDPNWKTIWISRIEDTDEDDQQSQQNVITEEYDISSIINRP